MKLKRFNAKSAGKNTAFDIASEKMRGSFTKIFSQNASQTLKPHHRAKVFCES